MKRLANCKINIGLDILRRRADGYHDLETVMVPVPGLCDTIELSRCSGSDARFSQRGIAVDCPPDENLCLRAFRLLQRHCGIGGVRITLDKRVPFGAGLGGGSSDATAVLLGLNELFSIGLSEEELIACAAELGSDTAFFVRNSPQLCTGRGERMEPVDLPLAGWRLAVVKPAESISTREAYAGVTPALPALPLRERIARPVASWQASVTNDFEASLFARLPRLARIKESMLAQGALYASLSGSGSALFGLFPDAGHYRPPFGDLFLHEEVLR